MTKDVVSVADAYDFSKYQPGDVIVIPMHQIADMGQTQSIMLTAVIANAATRAGLGWKTWHDEQNNEFRISFS